MTSSTSSASPPARPATERRTQRRVGVELPVSLSLRGVKTALTAVTKDLSWGGALLFLKQPLPPGDRMLRMVLPWKPEERITAFAQVLRVRELQEGLWVVATRFLSLSPRSNARLERLLGALAETTDPRNQSGPPGLARELEVDANDPEELRSIMEAIATGRYTLRVLEPYSPHQSLSFVLAGTDAWAGIRLRARVMEVKPATAPGVTGLSLFEMTLQFEHPKDVLASLIHYLLDRMAESGDTSTLLDWSQMAHSQLLGGQHQRSAHSSRPSSASPPPAPIVRSTARSTLEVDFPEALNYLMLGWGDVQAFEMLFRELMLGDRFNYGGWPPEAWQELTLLQDVHDLAYGLAGERDRFRRFGE